MCTERSQEIYVHHTWHHMTSHDITHDITCAWKILSMCLPHTYTDTHTYTFRTCIIQYSVPTQSILNTRVAHNVCTHYVRSTARNEMESEEDVNIISKVILFVHALARSFPEFHCLCLTVYISSCGPVGRVTASTQCRCTYTHTHTRTHARTHAHTHSVRSPNTAAVM